MQINVLPHLRLLPSLPMTRLPNCVMKPRPSSSRSVPILSQIFPFKLKYLGFGPSQAHFSTRPRTVSSAAFGRRKRGGGEDRGSKSLIEDEAELSDWVSDLRTSSFRGKLNSEDESDFHRARGRFGDRDRDRGRGSVRDRGRDREGFGVKRRRESYEDDFKEASRGRTRGQGGLFYDDDDEEKEDEDGQGKRFGLRRNDRGHGKGLVRGKRRFYEDEDGERFELQGKSRGNVDRMGGQRGGRGMYGKGKGLERGKRSFVDEDEEDEEDDDDDDDDDDLGMRSIEGLLSQESDESENDEDDGVLNKTARAALGLEKGFSGENVLGSPEKSDSYLSDTRFDQCSISPLSLKAIKDAGYERMTAVQEATLPIILKGKDVLAKAKTGTGKTVAFLLPSIEVVIKSPPVDRDQKRPPILVLVICPTRELASQAAAEANTLLKYHPSIGVQVVMGGTRLALEQKRMQANPCQILVATPGRLRDHMENTAGFATRLMGVKVLVLDEADHLLDMGFRKDIEKIIAAVPKQRQTLLFSATVPEEVRQVCHIALNRDHEFVNTVQEGTEETHAQVTQTHLVAPLEKQFPLLYVLLKDHVADNSDYKVLVFCTTAMVTRMVADFLGELKLNVREIHSRKPQSYRTRVSDEFRKSKGLILVTSDVSARGVDYPDVTLVIQVGLPADRAQYIHRLGRTGRKGKEGQGILLLTPWEEFFLSTIKDLPITKGSMPSIDPDTKKKVERALSHVEMKNKEAAYQAWLGYYNSNKKVGKDKYKLVELANEFSRSMGLDNPPAIPKVILGKMGLRNIPGLRSK